jgi:hypothetical protein
VATGLFSNPILSNALFGSHSPSSIQLSEDSRNEGTLSGTNEVSGIGTTGFSRRRRADQQRRAAWNARGGGVVLVYGAGSLQVNQEGWGQAAIYAVDVRINAAANPAATDAGECGELRGTGRRTERRWLNWLP